MTSLNLRQAINLYNALQDHIKNTNDIDVYELINSILNSIIETNRHKDFIIALAIILNKSTDEILKMNSDEAIESFANGLIENDITYLIEFCRSVIYAN